MLRNLLAKGSPDPHSKTMVEAECRDVYASSGALNDLLGTYNHNRVNQHCGNWIQTSITILEGMLMQKTMQG
ncbi:hypothetical protein GIB67_034999 [Kingdonia uniflora]|nr:hypothetical protein GIB67_034999 [Kingdonia uniflora]